MLLLNTQAAITNQNAPIYVRDPAAEAVLALGPTVWLEADPRFMVQSGSNVDAWVDRVSGRRFIPSVANRPTLVTSGAKSAVRFLSSPLIPEDGFETFTEDGTHTLVVLFKLTEPDVEHPTPGGFMVGSNGTSHQYMNAFNYQSGTLDIASGDVALNGSPNDFRDGDWHLEILSVPSTPGTPTASKLFLDGAEAQSFTGLKPPPAVGSRQMRIGGHGPLGNNLVLAGGYIGGIMYIPRKAVHLNSAELSALQSYWLARKAERV